MATITGETQVFDIKTGGGDHKTTAAGAHLKVCKISCFVNGTYADTDGITFDARAALATRRNGLTATIIDASFCGFGIKSEDNETQFGADEVATDGTNITAKLTTDDLSTNFPDGALAVPVEPLWFSVTFTEI